MIGGGKCRCLQDDKRQDNGNAISRVGSGKVPLHHIMSVIIIQVLYIYPKRVYTNLVLMRVARRLPTWIHRRHTRHLDGS